MRLIAQALEIMNEEILKTIERSRQGNEKLDISSVMKGFVPSCDVKARWEHIKRKIMISVARLGFKGIKNVSISSVGNFVMYTLDDKRIKIVETRSGKSSVVLFEKCVLKAKIFNMAGPVISVVFTDKTARCISVDPVTLKISKVLREFTGGDVYQVEISNNKVYVLKSVGNNVFQVVISSDSEDVINDKLVFPQRITHVSFYLAKSRLMLSVGLSLIGRSGEVVRLENIHLIDIDGFSVVLSEGERNVLYLVDDNFRTLDRVVFERNGKVFIDGSGDIVCVSIGNVLHMYCVVDGKLARKSINDFEEEILGLSVSKGKDVEVFIAVRATPDEEPRSEGRPSDLGVVRGESMIRPSENVVGPCATTPKGGHRPPSLRVSDANDFITESNAAIGDILQKLEKLEAALGPSLERRVSAIGEKICEMLWKSVKIIIDGVVRRELKLVFDRMERDVSTLVEKRIQTKFDASSKNQEGAFANMVRNVLIKEVVPIVESCLSEIRLKVLGDLDIGGDVISCGASDIYDSIHKNGIASDAELAVAGTDEDFGLFVKSFKIESFDSVDPKLMVSVIMRALSLPATRSLPVIASALSSAINSHEHMGHIIDNISSDVIPFIQSRSLLAIYSKALDETDENNSFKYTEVLKMILMHINVYHLDTQLANDMKNLLCCTVDVLSNVTYSGDNMLMSIIGLQLNYIEDKICGARNSVASA